MPARLLSFLIMSLLVGASSAHACKRRLKDFLPEGKPRTDFERGLWTISKNLENCYEFRLAKPPERTLLVGEAVKIWNEIRSKNLEPPEGLLVKPEEYRLIVESMDHYLDRIVEATDAEDLKEGRLQAVGLQHIIGEFYGNNPGPVTPLNALPYCFQTLAHIPADTPESIPAWKNRIALARLRIQKWLDGSDMPELASLRAVKDTRHQLDRLGALVGAYPEDGKAPESVLQWFQDQTQATAQKAEASSYEISAHANQVLWKPAFLPRYLSLDDPRYNPRAY